MSHPTGPRVCQACGAAFTGGLHPPARFCPACRLTKRVGRPPRCYIWTPAADALLRRRYDGRVRHRARDIAQQLGWPVWTIKKRAAVLGLCQPRSPWRDWTAEEDAFLAQWSGRRASEWIATRLKRTLTSVVVRQKRVGFVPRVRDGYLCQDVCACLGVDHDTVERWVTAGWLRVDRRPRRGPQGDFWRVQEADLVAFVRAHPECIDLAKVDQVWFHDVIVQAVALAAVAARSAASREALAAVRRIIAQFGRQETFSTVELHARVALPPHQVRLALRVLRDTGELHRVWQVPAVQTTARAS